MSFFVAEGCNGCGICVRACPRGAIHRQLDASPPYQVSRLDCNDCTKCAIVCPLHVIAVDPSWPACWSRGCPLTSRRYQGWACSERRLRCSDCGSALWKAPGSDRWACARCDPGGRVACPKIRRATAEASAEAPAGSAP